MGRDWISLEHGSKRKSKQWSGLVAGEDIRKSADGLVALILATAAPEHTLNP